MQNKFVSEDFIVPSKLENQYFHILPLETKHCILDYEAVMSSVSLLKGVYRDDPEWPDKDMTFEKDFSDLEYHQKEFKNRSSFTYTVLSLKEDKCLGCVYIYPSIKEGFDADIFMWVTQESFDKGLYKILFRTVSDWIATSWSFKKVNYIHTGEFEKSLL